MKKTVNDFGTYRKQCLEGKVLEANKERGGARFKIDDIDGGVREISAPLNLKKDMLDELIGYRVFYVIEERQRSEQERTGEVYFSNDGVDFEYRTLMFIDSNHALVVMEGPAVGKIYWGKESEKAGESDINPNFLKGGLK